MIAVLVVVYARDEVGHGSAKLSSKLGAFLNFAFTLGSNGEILEVGCASVKRKDEEATRRIWFWNLVLAKSDGDGRT